MSFAFMPLYTGDYHRDTRHLSMAEHGCYFLALTHCWDQKGPMPLDEKRQFAIVNARSNDEMEAWRRVRDEFFVQMDDGWYQPRMQREMQRAEAISGVRSASGKAGANARMQRLREAQASAKQMPSKSLASDATPTPTTTPTPTETSTATHEREVRASRLPAGFPDAGAIEWCEQKRPDLRAGEVAEKFRDYWTGVPGQRGRKLDWLATWRNFVRNERAAPHSGVSGRTALQAERARNLDLALGRTPKRPTVDVIDV